MVGWGGVVWSIWFVTVISAYAALGLLGGRQGERPELSLGRSRRQPAEWDCNDDRVIGLSLVHCIALAKERTHPMRPQYTNQAPLSTLVGAGAGADRAERHAAPHIL
jgi:hypothetical protein